MRRCLLPLVLLLLLIAILPSAAVPCARAQATIALNEFMAGPARDWDGNGTFSSRDDEWIEVVNLSTGAVDLAPYVLTDGDRIPRLALSGSLAAGEHLVVYGSTSYAWEKAHGYPAYGFSLANGGDKVMLWQVAGAETLLVDSYTFGSQEGASDRAVGRFPDGTGAWAMFDALNPYTGTTPPLGNGCAPTPGVENRCTSTPVVPATWGRIRSLYR